MNEEPTNTSEHAHASESQNDPTPAPHETAQGKTGERLEQSLGACMEGPEAAEAGADLPANPVPSADTGAGANFQTSSQAELDELRGEVSRLREELRAHNQFMDRMDRECEEFRQLFPEVPLSALPDSVWKDTEKGIPLAAAYALADRKRMLREQLAVQSNLQNQTCSSGGLESTPAEFFTADEVRAMSQKEVRRHFQKIMRSMPHWH